MQIVEMKHAKFLTKDLVWIWIQSQEPDVGIVIDCLEPCNGFDLFHHPALLVSVNGRLFRVKETRLWKTREEAIIAGPPFFIDEEAVECNDNTELSNLTFEGR
jgi:hypothetical protein